MSRCPQPFPVVTLGHTGERLHECCSHAWRTWPGFSPRHIFPSRRGMMETPFSSAFSVSTFVVKSFACYFGRFAGVAITAARDSEVRKHSSLRTRKLQCKHACGARQNTRKQRYTPKRDLLKIGISAMRLHKGDEGNKAHRLQPLQPPPTSLSSWMDGWMVRGLPLCIGQQPVPPSLYIYPLWIMPMVMRSAYAAFLFQLYRSIALGSVSFFLFCSPHRQGELAGCDARST